MQRRLTTRQELALAILPTGTVFAMLILLQRLGRGEVLFASLASSAFLIYLDPSHTTNSVRTLVVAQGSAALLGAGMYMGFGGGYIAAGAAMLGTILIMITLNATHPPAVGTAMSFAFRPSTESDLPLFAVAVTLVVVLIVVQRLSIRILRRFTLSDAIRAVKGSSASVE